MKNALIIALLKRLENVGSGIETTESALDDLCADFIKNPDNPTSGKEAKALLWSAAQSAGLVGYNFKGKPLSIDAARLGGIVKGEKVAEVSDSCRCLAKGIFAFCARLDYHNPKDQQKQPSILETLAAYCAARRLEIAGSDLLSEDAKSTAITELLRIEAEFNLEKYIAA